MDVFRRVRKEGVVDRGNLLLIPDTAQMDLVARLYFVRRAGEREDNVLKFTVEGPYKEYPGSSPGIESLAGSTVLTRYVPLIEADGAYAPPPRIRVRLWEFGTLDRPGTPPPETDAEVAYPSLREELERTAGRYVEVPEWNLSRGLIGEALVELAEKATGGFTLRALSPVSDSSTARLEEFARRLRDEGRTTAAEVTRVGFAYGWDAEDLMSSEKPVLDPTLHERLVL